MKTLKRLVTVLCLVLGWVLTPSVQAALVVIAHPSNSITAITAEDVTHIYMGRTGVFASGMRAIPVDQVSGSPQRVQFYKTVIQKDEGALKVYWSRLQFAGKGQPPREVGDNAAVKSWVAANPEAIGYIDDKFVDSNVKVLFRVP